MREIVKEVSGYVMIGLFVGDLKNSLAATRMSRPTYTTLLDLQSSKDLPPVFSDRRRQFIFNTDESILLTNVLAER